MGLGSTPGPQTVYTSAAQNHSRQQQTASLLTTYCTLLSQGAMGQHCLRHCLRIEKRNCRSRHLLLVLCCLLRAASRSCCLLILVDCRSVLHVACYRPLAIVLRVACCCVLFADCCLLPSAHCWWHVFGCFLLAVACCTLHATSDWSMVHTPTYACIQHKHTHVHLHVYMYM